MEIKEIQTGIAHELMAGSREIAIDISELGLDSLLDEGILKDIPVINIIVAVCKTGLNIKDRFFAKKLIKFIDEYRKNDYFSDQFDKFKLKMQDRKFQRKVTESLIVIIDKIEELHRITVLSKLFKGFIDCYITWEEFTALSRCADVLTNEDYTLVEYLGTDLINGHCISISEYKEFEGNIFKLMHYNLVEMKILQSMFFGVNPATIIYKLTNVGIKLNKCINQKYGKEELIE